ncbi:hypothetical protein BDR26DRAFT_856658 [Obelidium mucronatum]|nr:hypothetical protein BDR26DRAFT_856658 [Obelidium mucronatum]
MCLRESGDFVLETRAAAAFHGPVAVYKHARTQLRVVFAALPGPLVSAQVVLPTGALDDAGLPHTLEHLVFCGSAAFPRRGFLDTLATRSLSTGSNAYTAEDHTCYSIATAGAEGFCRVLPCLVDHILNPTLTDEQFITEVYHIDGTGAENGVVFCEMAGREYTEGDLVDLKIRQTLFPNTAYAFECGGKTDSIRHLTNADIKSYHKRFYSADRMTILICGTVDHESIFKALRAVDLTSSTNSSDSQPTTQQHESIEFTTSQEHISASVAETVEFPSQDESHGSIVFAWKGPHSNDFRKIVSLDILLRFLQDTSASPLYQTFVETEEPWAAEVDYDVKSYLQTAIVLYFSGVKLKGQESLDDADAGNEDDMEVEEGEDGDDDWVDEDGSHDGPSLTMTRGAVFRIVRELLNEPMEYWSGLVKTWLLDQAAAQFIAKPSRSLAAQLASKEAQALALRKQTLGETGLAKLNELSVNAFNANKVDLPESVLNDFPSVPDVADLPKLTCDMSIHDISTTPESTLRPLTQAQIVQTETLFTHFRIAFNISSLPAKLRPYLVLFQELLFQSPVAVPNSPEIDYRTVIKKTAETFVSHEASCRFRKRHVELRLAFRNVYGLLCRAIQSNFTQSIEWVLHVILFTKFTKERVVSAIQKLSSDLMDIKRDGSCLHCRRKEEDDGGRVRKSKSGGSLKGVKAVIDSLEALKSAIVVGMADSPGFVQLGLPLDSDESGVDRSTVLDLFLKKWDQDARTFYSLTKQRKGAAASLAFPLLRHPFDGITASYMSIIVPCDVLKTKDYYAVTLLAELLSRAEGPLYTSIRGKAWSSHLTFDLSESSDPYRACSGFADIASAFNIETARASVVYRVVTEKATGGGCIGSTLRRCLRGFMTDEQERQFLDESKRIVTLITKSQEAQVVGGKFPLNIRLKLVHKLSEFDL